MKYVPRKVIDDENVGWRVRMVPENKAETWMLCQVIKTRMSGMSWWDSEIDMTRGVRVTLTLPCLDGYDPEEDEYRTRQLEDGVFLGFVEITDHPVERDEDGRRIDPPEEDAETAEQFTLNFCGRVRHDGWRFYGRFAACVEYDRYVESPEFSMSVEWAYVDPRGEYLTSAAGTSIAPIRTADGIEDTWSSWSVIKPFLARLPEMLP